MFILTAFFFFFQDSIHQEGNRWKSALEKRDHPSASPPLPFCPRICLSIMEDIYIDDSHPVLLYTCADFLRWQLVQIFQVWEEDKLDPSLLIKLQASQSALNVMLVKRLEHIITGCIQYKAKWQRVFSTWRPPREVLSTTWVPVLRRNSMQVFHVSWVMVGGVSSSYRLEGNTTPSEWRATSFINTFAVLTAF